MAASELLDVLPERADNVDKTKVRLCLEEMVDPRRLFSFDEWVGIVFTLVPAAFAVTALLVDWLRLFLGVSTAVAVIFFWTGYRIARAKHAIELRLGIAGCFVSFLGWVVAFVFMLGFGMAWGFAVGSSMGSPELLLIPVSIIIVLAFTSGSLRFVNRPWFWLTGHARDSWTPWTDPQPYRIRSFYFVYSMEAFGTWLMLFILSLPVDLTPALFVVLILVLLLVLGAVATVRDYRNSYKSFARRLVVLRGQLQKEKEAKLKEDLDAPRYALP